MYLRRLEMAGFKSFAERTNLEFEPGLIAIVGPNGCGKSNISDAVRWVLGEQSARALRGAGMTDFIFSGTDTHKPMGMAEVSLTLSGCDGELNLGYHEVTVTRRVYRTGEGEYLINKTPCRLKDIHRLFMDTGIGTNAYSLMEQGRIDLILSSRPEDRREVFEEASGISRFKADRAEAMRKLEHTEANLVRLGDILAGIRRQIISLQRQAGKARRYQALAQELRGVDLHFIRRKAEAIDRDAQSVEVRRAGLAEREEAMVASIRDAERRIEAGRVRLAELEQSAEATRDLAAQARAERNHAVEAIAHHEQRLEEYDRLQQEGARQLDAAQRQAEELRRVLEGAAAETAAAEARRREADEALAGRAAALREREEEFEAASRELQRLRAESVDLDHRVAQRTNDLADLDAREKGAAARRERLRVEQSQLTSALADYERQRAASAAREAEQMAAVRAAEQRLEDLLARRRRLEEDAARLDGDAAAHGLRAAALEARIEAIDAAGGASSAGVRAVEAAARAAGAEIAGLLADLIEVDTDVRIPLEAVLRPWADAVVARTAGGARALLRALETGRGAATRLVAPPPAGAAAPAPVEAGVPDAAPLAARVRCPAELREMIERLLVGVFVVADIPDGAEPPANVVWVTPGGQMVSGRGVCEWWNPDAAAGHPLAARRQREELERELAETTGRQAAAAAGAEGVRSELRALEADLADARRAADVARMAAAMTEGERAVLARQEQENRRRVETVAMELEAMGGEDRATQERRERLHAALTEARARQAEVRSLLAAQSDRARELEQQRTAMTHEVAEARIAAADRRREVEALAQRAASYEQRIRELETLIAERGEALALYRRRTEESLCALAAARDSLQPLEAEEQLHLDHLASLRRERDELAGAVQKIEAGLRADRDALDAVRRAAGALDVELAEARMRRQNLMDRAVAEHRVTAEEVFAAARPEGEDLPPDDDLDAWEALVAEMKARLQSMGPVNLVAIEECQKLEEEHAFRSAQQDDLVRSKQQLLDLIRRINQTSTEMFRETFARVNERFGEIFARLFNGGAAKLVLVDEGDVLESGIEIIARPPGKKLQAVSLLSGGERTMTAVALLFALYAIKPSPFCVLDEIDAALDDSNIGRFIALVKEFVSGSQFIVITHNSQTIGASDILYGVTMEQRGVSKIVSVKFNRHGAPAEPVVAEPPRPPAGGSAAPAPTETGA